MNKSLIISIFLGIATLAGFLHLTNNTQNSSFLNNKYKYENEFKQFTVKFQKQYGHDEGFYRYQKFEANMEFIKSHNALYDAGNSTYFLGVNPLADMDKAEYKQRLLGYKVSQEDVKVKDKHTFVTVPESVDWVVDGAVNAVQNQGQCGSCWAFSAVAALEGLYFQKNNYLEKMSEQSVVDCSTKNNGCSGGLMDYAFQYTQTNGIPLEMNYQYTAAQGTCQNFESMFKNGGYQDVSASSENALLAAIAQQPVSVAIEADTQGFQLYSGGVFNDSECGTQLDHGVAAVGYGTDYIKIRNSWGGSWGESGYIRFARTGDGSGMCGVQLKASYPTA